MKKSEETYSAAVARGDQAGVVVEVAISVIAAGVAQVVTNQLDLEVKVGTGGRLVLEHGQPGGAGRVANTQVHRGPVTDGLGAVTPLATSLGGNALVVDVVLSGGGLALPLEVGGTVGAGQGVLLSSESGQRNGLGLSTGVVGTANCNLGAEVVANVDTTSTLNAESFVFSVGEIELAVLALQTTDGLASGTLGGGPLGLLVTGGTGVRAHGAAGARVTGDSGHDLADHGVGNGDVLDTRVTTEAEVVKGDGTVVGGEGATVNLTIGELSSNTGTGGAGRAGGGGSSGGAGGAGGAGGRSHGAGAGRAGDDGSGGLKEDLGSNGSGGGNGSRGAHGGAGAGRASVGDSGTQPLELVRGQKGAGLLLSDVLRGTSLAGVQDNEVVDGRTGGDGSLGLGLNDALVEVSVAMAVGGHQGARRGESHGNGVGELHCGFRNSNCGSVDGERKMSVNRFPARSLSFFSREEGVSGSVAASLIHVVLLR